MTWSWTEKIFNLFIFLHIPKFKGSLSIVLAWNWAPSGGGLLPLNESAAKFDFRAQKFLQLCQLSSIAGLSSGQLPCYDHLYAFWGRSYLSNSCYGDMPRVMNTILITMMRAVRMGLPARQWNLSEGVRAPYLMKEGQGTLHERCMTRSRLRLENLGGRLDYSIRA